MPLMMVLYRWLLRLLLPIILFWLMVRVSRGKEQWQALPEKLGFTRAKRPFKNATSKNATEQKIIWLHAISVGESLSALSVMEALHQQYPDYHFLLTSGTVTSKKIITQNKKDFFTHQFAPLDYPFVIKRFLKYWRPEMVLMFESEIWPNLLYYSHQYCDERVFLLQGRISPKTLMRWQKYPHTVAYLMQFYRMIFAQSQGDAESFKKLGASNITVSGNLKFLNPPLPYNKEKLSALKTAIGARKFYVMASTHRGEEEIALQAHRVLLQKFPDFLTIIIPRHPERGKEISTLLTKHQIPYKSRSKKALPNKNTQIYLADTLGETGLFFALADIVCVAGSFMPHGGHNIYEPIQMGAIVLHGESFYNCTDMQAELAEHGLCQQVNDADELAEKIVKLLGNDSLREIKKSTAKQFIHNRPQILSLVVKKLSEYF